VSIDLRVEKPILLRVFARTLSEPRDYDTILKWWKRGLLNRDTGKRVRLETVRLSSGRYTTQQAYDRFIGELNGSFHGGAE
jgi:hypothetical protein